LFDFVLVLRITLVPVLILAASIAADRWGQGVGGWLVSLPLTSGPIVFLLALSQGEAFASGASVGVIIGLVAVSVFAITYCVAALRSSNRKWYFSMPQGWIAFLIVGLALGLFTFSILSSFVLEVVLLIVILIILSSSLRRYDLREQNQFTNSNRSRTGRLDLLIRIVAATVLVYGITQTAPALGSHLSGVLATFPAYISVLSASVHRSKGAVPAARLVRGALYGLFTPAVFFLIIGLYLVPLGIGYSFGLAIVVSLVVHGLSLLLVKGWSPIKRQSANHKL
jgi:hypothetical protein